MLRRAAERCRSLARATLLDVHHPCASRDVSHTVNARRKAEETTEQKELRARAEKAAERKIRASDSPLFNWVEVDVKNDDTEIPRWQNAVFIVVAGTFLAYFGHKLAKSELERRARATAAKENLESRARAVIRERMREGRSVADVAADDAFEGLAPEEIDALVSRERDGER